MTNHSTPEALGAAIKDQLANWEPFLSVMRDAARRKAEREAQATNVKTA